MDFIYTADNAMPASLCDELISRFSAHSGTQPGVSSAGLDPSKKSSIDITIDAFPDLADIHRKVLDVCLEDLTNYFVRYPFVGSLTPIITNNVTGEETELTMANIGTVSRDTVKMLIPVLFRSGTINIQKYPAGSGGYPLWHCEISPEETLEHMHRIVLWMYYLNDVETGGETEFYFQKRAIQPKKGTVVIAPAGFTHTHRGNAPLSGDKYVVTSWLLYKRFQKRPTKE